MEFSDEYNTYLAATSSDPSNDPERDAWAEEHSGYGDEAPAGFDEDSR